MKFLPASIRRALVLLAVLATASFGQTYTGTINGLVTDAQGAKVTGARVTLINSATRETRAIETNDEGRYAFVQLQPGSYSVRVTMAGFQESITSNIELIAS